MKQINNQKGFSLIMALMAIAILGFISMAMMTIFKNFNSQSRHFNSMVGARTLISTIQGVVAYPNLCIANLAPSSQLNFNVTQAATNDGVPISILLGGGPTGLIAQAGSILRSYDVEIESLAYRNVHLIGSDPTVLGNTLYSGELMLKLKKIGLTRDVAGGTSLRERSLGTMTVSVNPSLKITSCYTLTDARQSCEEVGGTYDDTSTPKCKLPYPCEGKGDSIFLGYDQTTKLPICKTMGQIVGSFCKANEYVISNGSGGVICKPL